MRVRSIWFAAVLAGTVLVPSMPARAATITVTTTTDEYGAGAACSLREATKAADDDTAFGGCPAGSGTDTIAIPAGDYVFTIPGQNENDTATGDLDLLSDVTLQGPTTGTATIDADDLDRALDVLGGTVIISRLTIRDGSVQFGGGVRVRSGATLTVQESTFVSNRAIDDGSGIHSLGTLVVSNSTIEENGGGVEGGGINVGGGSLTATGTVVRDNDAQNGGGINIEAGGTATLSATSVLSNDSVGSGGGLFSQGSLTVEDSEIRVNDAGGSAGGIWNTGSLSVTRSLIANNSANLTGGGVSSSGPISSLTVTDSWVLNNTADEDNNNTGNGGGVYSLLDSSVDISGTTFSGNKAVDGDGVLIADSAGASLRNVTITGNGTAGSGGLGGGLYSTDGAGPSLRLNNVTFDANATNAAGGGGNIWSSGPLTVADTLMGDDLAGGNCGGSLPTSTSLSLEEGGGGAPCGFTLVADVGIEPLAERRTTPERWHRARVHACPPGRESGHRCRERRRRGSL